MNTYNIILSVVLCSVVLCVCVCVMSVRAVFISYHHLLHERIRKSGKGVLTLVH